MTTDRNTPEALAFRRAYQVLVDNSPPAPDAPLQAIVTPRDPEPPRSRRLMMWAIIGFGVVSLAVLGIIWLRQPTSMRPAGVPVERIALGDANQVLGGPAVVVNSNVSTFDVVSSDMRMWVWSSQSGESKPLVLLDIGQGQTDIADLVGVLPSGTAPQPPPFGAVEMIEFPERGWTAVSWSYEDRWRVLATSAGSPEVLAAFADTIGSNDPSAAALPELVIDYAGEQILYPQAGTALYELFYNSPAGFFSLLLFDGFDAVRAVQFSGLTTDIIRVGQSPGVVADDGSGPTLLWEVGPNQAAGLDLEQLPLETAIRVAEAIVPVTADEWDVLATSTSN